MTRTEHLLAVLQPGRVLTASDVERLRTLLPPSTRRAGQLDRRDAAVRACFDELRGYTAKAAARRIETDLGRHLAAGWLLEQRGSRRPDPAGIEGAVRRLARANQGKPLGVRQLLNIAAGSRCNQSRE